MNKFVKDNLKVIITIILLILLFLFLFNNLIFVGKIINIILQCETPQTSSFPCYGVYILYSVLMILLAIILLSLSITYKLFKVTKKTFVKVLLSLLVVSLLLGLMWTIGALFLL